MFSLGQFQFIDSLQFLSSSLDNLIKDFKMEDFKITSRMSADEYKLKLLSSKGIYPCE